MPTIDRPGTRTRPETFPEEQAGFSPVFELEPGGALLKISWDVKPVEARHVHLLFSGIEKLLNQIARAVLESQFPEFSLGEKDDILEIEVLELELGTIWTTLGVAFSKTCEATRHPVVGGSIVAVFSYLLFSLNPMASLHKKPEPLPKAKQEGVQKQVDGFKTDLKRSGHRSQLIVRVESTGDQAKIDLI